MPTRELAAQIRIRFATYGRFLELSGAAVFGGVDQTASGVMREAMAKGGVVWTSHEPRQGP